MERVCGAAARIDRTRPADRMLFVAHGILWAAMTIGGAVLAKTGGSSASSAFEWMLFLIVIPGWLASEQLLRHALRARNREPGS